MTTTFGQPAAAFVQPPTDGLAATVIETVKQTAASAPRSLQSAVGPSELGTPCTRRLAYRLLDWDPKPNGDTDPWAAIQGTAVHAWMAETYEAENRRLGRQRYLVEQRVHLPGVSGSADLFDRDIASVVDWKFTGLPRLKEYRLRGPGQQYRWQAHTYGLGMQLAGETVERVAIVFLPRGGRIDQMYAWSEPYDYRVALQALARYQTTRDAVVALDPEKYPERWAAIPTGDAHCAYCPFYLPGSTDLGSGCPGHQPNRTNRTSTR
jgi:hypothetical protein